jgi:serine/threonine protein kinase
MKKNNFTLFSCYVAPEVLSKKGYDGFKSDVWSLGVILFIMVTGALPFDDDNLAGLFAKIKKGKVVYPNYLKEDLVDLFQHIFVVNPNDRFTLAEVMKHPWFTIGYKNINEDSFITLEEDDEDFKKIEDVEEKIKKSKHLTKIIP